MCFQYVYSNHWFVSSWQQYIEQITCLCWYQKCAESGFLDSYSVPGSEISNPAPGVTPDLKKLIDFYSWYTHVLVFEKLEVSVITLLVIPALAPVRYKKIDSWSAPALIEIAKLLPEMTLVLRLLLTSGWWAEDHEFVDGSKTALVWDKLFRDCCVFCKKIKFTELML